MQQSHRRVAIAAVVLSVFLALAGVLAAVRGARVRREASPPPQNAPVTPPATASTPPPASSALRGNEALTHASVPAAAPAASTADGKPVISEFMASNKETLKDSDGDKSDWIEIHNPATRPVDLDGWYLTDDPGSPKKWRFPPVTVGPRGYLLVFASGKNRSASARELHANFKLRADAGYLALVEPDGRTVAPEFAPPYSKQAADVSFGLAQDVADLNLVTQGAEARVLVPVNDELGLDWTALDFDDSGWVPGRTGVGYDTGSAYKKLIATDLRAQMFGANATVYVRIPFDVTDRRPYQSLSLRIKYDDGFIAYLNGEPVASRAAPRKANWNSSASSRRADDQAAAFEEIDLSGHVALLRPGRNVLAIHGLNRPADSSDMLILPELRAGRATLARGAPGVYFPLPTPGRPNAPGTTALGPAIKQVGHAPAEPTDGQDLAVRATVSRFDRPVKSVTLHSRVMFRPEVHIAMLDDGAHGDGAAGDGVYGAAIPADASAPGEMVRYRVTAADDGGAESSLPQFADPLHSEQYLGTVVAGATIASRLPVLQWFVEHPDRAGRSAGTRASVFHGGELYDNVFVRKRGVSSSGWPKPNYKFDFPKDHHFRFGTGQSRVEEFNLQSTHGDKSYVRQVLAWETFRDAGSPYCLCFPMRVHQNGEFFSVALFVEHPDERYLKRLGLDPRGPLYKFVDNSGLRRAAGFEKKTRVEEGTADLETLVNGIAESNPDRARYLFDHVDLPQVTNYLAAYVLTHDNDAILKNFFMYLDPGGGGWKVLPWDKDLTFGRNHYPGEGVLNDMIMSDHPVHSHPLVGDSDHPKNHYATTYNALTDAIHDTPATRQMFLRRLRTLMDQMLQAPETPADALLYERRIDALHELMAPDVALDRRKWGNPYGQDQDFATALAALKEQYLAPRRRYLYETHGPGNGGIIPPPQPAEARVDFGEAAIPPVPGDHKQAYLQLDNTNTYAVDVSGWRLEGSIRHRFPAGTVLPAGGSLYLCADRNAFRARATGPRGGQGLFVQECQEWHHPATSPTVELSNAMGDTVAVLENSAAGTSGGAPTPAPATEVQR
jgi:hypothetical protein